MHRPQASRLLVQRAGVEPALADPLRAHPALESIELVEAIDRHLPSRAKDDLGRALLENKHQKLGFLHCDVFIVSEETKSLVWPKEASTSDAVLLADLLQTNTTLTSFNIATGATLENKARSALGEALLSNENARVAFCNDFGLAPNVDSCEFDLSRTELKEVEPFRLLGCLRGNRTLTHVTLMQLRMEQISTLALALRGNSTLAQLDIIHTTRMGGQSVVRLAVPMLNGSQGSQRETGASAESEADQRKKRKSKEGEAAAKEQKENAAAKEQKENAAKAAKATKDAKDAKAAADGAGAAEEKDAENDEAGNAADSSKWRVDLSDSCIEGFIGRVACAMIGTLIASNTSLRTLDLSNTGVGQAIASEGEGGHILLRPMCESDVCPLSEIILTNIQLNDKAGQKLMSALTTGLGKGDCGYEKITALNLSQNELGKGFITALKQMLWGERAACMLQTLDVSNNPTLDGYDLGLALKRNESLTSLNISDIPSANTDDVYSVHRRLFAAGRLPVPHRLPLVRCLPDGGGPDGAHSRQGQL